MINWSLYAFRHGFTCLCISKPKFVPSEVLIVRCSFSYFFVMSSDGELCKTLKVIDSFFVRNKTAVFT